MKDNVNSTQLIYLEYFNAVEYSAEVVFVDVEDGKTIVLLDQTIFYPQDGGQPYDQGTIESNNAKFIVEEVRFVDGVVRHIGHFESGELRAGDEVTCKVDVDRRKLHSRLHSAGHVVDMALQQLSIQWIPVKGYHFPEGPYVEYQGDLPVSDKAMLKQKIESVCNEMVKKGASTKLVFMEKSEMGAVCHYVPVYIPEGKQSRVVMYGNFGVPCGGTHVNNVRDVGTMHIRKLKTGKGRVRVGYDID